MIYITGDCHGNFERFNPSIFPEQNEMTKEDYVVICGDFGGVWHREAESKEETMKLDWLDSRPFTTLLSVVIMRILTVYISIRLRIGTVARFIK